jgi:hypothetical protein
MNKAAEAAARVLQESKGPLSPSEIADVAVKKGYWKTRAQNRAASISGAISRENKRLGARSRFRSAGRGRWTLRAPGRMRSPTQAAQRRVAQLPDVKKLRAHAKQVRTWVAGVLKDRREVLSIAVMSGRKRFESWLKFELAARIAREGGEDVTVEKFRRDVAYRYKGRHYLLELKTANHGGSIEGLPRANLGKADKTKDIAEDMQRIRDGGQPGIVAFVVYPGDRAIPDWPEDFVRQVEDRGREKLRSTRLQVRMAKDCCRVPLETTCGQRYEAVVGAIPVHPDALE